MKKKCLPGGWVPSLAECVSQKENMRKFIHFLLEKYKTMNAYQVGLLTSSLSSRPFCGGTLVGIEQLSKHPIMLIVFISFSNHHDHSHLNHHQAL